MAGIIGNRRFRPGVVPTLAVAVCLPAFLALGNWQLDRAAQKRERLAQFAAGETTALVAAIAEAGAAPAGYRHVRGEGEWLADRQVLLESMPHGGRTGFQVLTPLRVDGFDALVMVDRGWLEQDFAVGGTPVLDTLPTGRVNISGRLHTLPEPALRLGAGAAPAAADDRDWPLRLLYPTAATLTALLGEPVYDGRVLLDADSGPGFLRDWQPDTLAPQRHVGYAVQWFAFAATLVVLYVALNFRRPAPPADAAGRRRHQQGEPA